MVEGMREDDEREFEQFKRQMVAANPGKAKEIYHMFDAMRTDAEEQAAPPPELPQSHDEVNQVLQDLRQFGVSLQV